MGTYGRVDCHAVRLHVDGGGVFDAGPNRETVWIEGTAVLAVR